MVSSGAGDWTDQLRLEVFVGSAGIRGRSLTRCADGRGELFTFQPSLFWFGIGVRWSLAMLALSHMLPVLGLSDEIEYVWSRKRSVFGALWFSVRRLGFFL